MKSVRELAWDVYKATLYWPERKYVRQVEQHLGFEAGWDAHKAALTPEALAEALCDAMPHEGGGSQLIYEDALEAAQKALQAVNDG